MGVVVFVESGVVGMVVSGVVGTVVSGVVVFVELLNLKTIGFCVYPEKATNGTGQDQGLADSSQVLSMTISSFSLWTSILKTPPLIPTKM